MIVFLTKGVANSAMQYNHLLNRNVVSILHYTCI